MSIGSVSSAAAGGGQQATAQQVAVAKQQQKAEALEGRGDLDLIKSAAVPSPESPEGTGRMVNSIA